MHLVDCFPVFPGPYERRGRDGGELQVGDRVMVVGPAMAVAQVADVLGNSLKKLNQPNLVTIFVGIALGVLLGSIPLLNVPQPVKLGLAGGPLIVAILIIFVL